LVVFWVWEERDRESLVCMCKCMYIYR
jgi:hypothetical protein